jgi:queuine tRNA-ribosyltransferase
VCARWSRAYLRHLLVVDEPTAPRLLTLHNVWWTLRLVEEVRSAVEAGSLHAVRSRIAAAYG